MPASPFILIERVSKSFQADPRTPPIAVIDDVSISIDQGELIVFLGPSGCGKTTLMRIVGGLETATRGRVLIDGQPVTGPDRQKGMVFQSYSSFPWLNVIDNIRFGLKFRDDIERPGEAAAGAATISTSSALRVSRTTTSIASPAACASGWRSRAPWRPGRTCC